MKAMLRGLVGVVVLLLGTQKLPAVEPSDWYPSQDVVARQAKLREQRIQAAFAYYEREIIGQYNKVGLRNPRWDTQVVALFRANIRERIGEYPDAGGLRLYASNECVMVNPGDPFAFYLYAQTLPRTSATKDEYRLALEEACDRIRASGYSGIIRFHALCRMAELKGTAGASGEAAGDMAVAENILRQALKELDGIAQAKDLPACEINTMMRTAVATSMALYKDRWKWTAQVYEVLAKHQGQRSELLTAKGELFVDYAWDARGDGWASTVTDEGWELMRQRLETAEADFTAAWQKDPNWAGSAIGMLGVELGQSKGSDVMEMWFRRAIALDPQSAMAYERKRYYLEAKWHGSDAEMLGFAREVAVTVPKTSPMRLILCDAHQSLAHAAGGQTSKSEVQYFRQHPKAWAELKAIADDVVLAKDASNYCKTEMARVAVNAGDIASARRYLAVADEELSESVFGEEYRRIRDILDEKP